MQEFQPKAGSFLDTYVRWADNGHAPRVFHLWAGISAVAACLERKVWLPFDGGKFNFFPNLYTFFVAHPAVGKSSAIDRVKNCLADLNQAAGGSVTFIPNTLSVSSLIECMTEASRTRVEGTRVSVEQSAAYFVAGEGSESLSAIHSGGELTNCLTSLYDCLEKWERQTRAHGNEIIHKGCFNMLMGTTFAFLGRLLAGDAIMGGFASRVTYVIYDKKFIRPSSGLRAGQSLNATEAYVRAPREILEGFARVHQMRGSFTCTDEFIDAWEEWHPKAQEARQKVNSEKMQALLGRKDALLLKLSMILSASAASDRILRLEHWQGALALAESCEEKLPELLRVIQTDPTSSTNPVQPVFAFFDSIRSIVGGQIELKQFLLVRGYDPYQIDRTVVTMIENKLLGIEGRNVRLLVDPNTYL